MRPIAAVVRRALVAAACLAVSLPTAPTTGADPDAAPPPPEAAPVADGALPSNPPVVLNTPDGWTLGVGARDEAQVPVAPLTTAVSSREYLASGIFVASLMGPGRPQGVLEVGYEIGCGIDMSTSDGVTIGGTAGITPGVTGPVTGVPGDVLPLVVAPIAGVLNVGLKPGLVIVVPVVKKQFRGPNPWVMVSNFHVKIDGCVGESFIRSYAVLNRVTDDSDVVLSYVGVTKKV
ncbi:MspA family porin [Mycobacterium colombiense]|uniref:MspA family porin n=1 Tax=Mycobacterium colombiense TaxID=339268 RepID=UPI003D328761